MLVVSINSLQVHRFVMACKHVTKVGRYSGLLCSSVHSGKTSLGLFLQG